MRLLFLLCVLSGTARAWEPPRPHEYAALGTSLALIWTDVGQTRWVAARYPGHWHESGFIARPFLGAHPSQGRIFWMGGVLPSVLLTGLFFALPEKWRLLPCGGVILGEGINVTLNATDGFGLRF